MAARYFMLKNWQTLSNINHAKVLIQNSRLLWLGINFTQTDVSASAVWDNAPI